jgi:hypothetical protein
MPTENRSSTIEQHDHIEGIIDMVSAPLQHEDRYIVVKRSDLALLSPVDSDLAHSYLEGVMSLMAEWDCPARECLVIESDWPEFAPAWASIEARITGRPASQPHAEPVAWMVGTAIWWTKEEAERDAIATGLPIVGMGPMTGVAEVERLSRALKLAGHWCDSALNAAQRVEDSGESLGDIASLLRHQAKDIEAALSASAEPSAPTWSCQPCQLEQPTDRQCDVCGAPTELIDAKS